MFVGPARFCFLFYQSKSNIVRKNRNQRISIHMCLPYPVSPLFLASLDCKANTSLAPAHMAVFHWLYTALKSTLFVLSLLGGIYLVKSLAFRRLARGEDKRGCMCVCQRKSEE